MFFEVNCMNFSDIDVDYIKNNSNFARSNESSRIDSDGKLNEKLKNLENTRC